MAVNTTLPTSKPNSGLVTFTIKIGGKAISKKYGVFSIVVIREINKIPSANILIQDGSAAKSDFEASNQDLFIPGKEIEILSGNLTKETTIFKGIIVKFGIKVRNNGASMLILDCRDKFVKLTIGPKSKYFVNKKDSEAIEEIINAYDGLQKEIQPTTLEHKDLVQFGATDWDFILTRVEANGKVCIVNDGKIDVKSPSLDGNPVVTLKYGTSILDFDATIDARDQYQAVKASAWDPSQQDMVEVDAEDPAIDGNGNLTPADLSAVIGLDHLSLTHTGMLEQEELQAWADGQFLRNQLAKTRGRVGYTGSAEIKPGDTIQLEGLGDRMNGKVYVSGIRHEISGGTWKTDAQFGLSPEWFTQMYPVSQLPATGILPAIQGLQIGIVSQLKDDPDNEDRILF